MNNKIAIQMDDIKTIDYAFDSSFMIGLKAKKEIMKYFIIIQMIYTLIMG